MDMHDKTGTTPSAMDYREAIETIQRAIVKDIAKLPPHLAVQLPNIYRCLVAAAGAARVSPAATDTP